MRAAPSRAFALVSLLFFALAARPAPAQVCVPDGLDGAACCGPTGAILPQFPAFPQMQTRWICFDNCQQAAFTTYCVNVGTPIKQQIGGGTVCGAYSIRFTVRTCAALVTIWNGSMNAYYSRNWQESSVVGSVNLTVWRFVINGDMLPSSALPNTPCDRPGCLGTYARVYFTGYIDYAFDCTTGQWSTAWALTHECDGLHHAAGTVRPAPAGGLHPTRSFMFVAPDAGFVVAPASVIQSNGTIVQEAVRWNNWGAVPNICTIEERANGTFQAQTPFCFCSTAGGTQYIPTAVNAAGVCGTAISPSALGPLFQKRVGRWTNPNAYPGVEFLLIDLGYLSYTNGCTGVSTLEWFEGVETVRGFQAFDFGGNPLGIQFEDLGSANQSVTSQAVRIGAPHVVYYHLNFNLP